MRREMPGKRSPKGRKRVLYSTHMDNAALVVAVVQAARNAADGVTWRNAPQRRRVPELLHRYVTTRTRYRAENSTQVIRYPSALVRERVGDCKSTAVFIAALAAAAGCSSSVVFIRQANRPWWSHVFAVVDGVVVDPLLPLDREAPNTGRREYLIA
jgi:hypothetical protein